MTEAVQDLSGSSFSEEYRQQIISRLRRQADKMRDAPVYLTPLRNDLALVMSKFGESPDSLTLYIAVCDRLYNAYKKAGVLESSRLMEKLAEDIEACKQRLTVMAPEPSSPVGLRPVP